MRKIIVFENLSLDGFFAGPNDEIDWAIHDDEITEYSKEGQDSVNCFLFGRVTYEMMASFWPTPVGQSTNPTFADALNNSPKIVFSKSLDKAAWQNTEIIKELSKGKIEELKQSDGKNIMIFGSGMIVGELTNLGLIDEYQILINPIILGAGKPLFKDLKQKTSLKLTKTKQFKSGVMLLTYELAK